MKSNVFRCFLAISGGGIGTIAGFSLMYFGFDVPARDAIFDLLFAEIGLLFAGFLVDRIERKKKNHA